MFWLNWKNEQKIICKRAKVEKNNEKYFTQMKHPMAYT